MSAAPAGVTTMKARLARAVLPVSPPVGGVIGTQGKELPTKPAGTGPVLAVGNPTDDVNNLWQLGFIHRFTEWAGLEGVLKTI